MEGFLPREKSFPRCGDDDLFKCSWVTLTAGDRGHESIMKIN
jgi:hypothetical protein